MTREGNNPKQEGMGEARLVRRASETAWNLAANSKNQPTVANGRGSGGGMIRMERSQWPFRV